MIELTNITKKYPHCDALENVSLAIPDGQFVAITGESGSGKSTLLSIMSGLNTPTSGTVKINGTDLASLNDRAMSRFRNSEIGFVFQNYYLVPEYTVLQNVEFPLLFRKRDNNAVSECENVLDLVGILDKKNEKAGNLSGGEQQRCAIARALVTDPQILFADEPCGNLDSNNRNGIMSLFLDMKKKGKTIVLITHNNEDAFMADRVIKLHDGFIIEDTVINA